MPEGPVSFQLEEATGRQPVILLFAPSERSPAYENQIALLADDKVIDDLDAVLVRSLAGGTSYLRNERLDDASSDALRTAYQVDKDDFLIVFLAVDGSEIHRSDAPVPPSIIVERYSDGSRRQQSHF